MEENKSWEWSTVEKTTHRNQSYDLQRNLTKKKKEKRAGRIPWAPPILMKPKIFRGDSFCILFLADEDDRLQCNSNP